MGPPLVTRHGPSAIPRADYYEVPKEIRVFSWCASPDGTGLPTQVHLHFGEAPGNVFFVRFKGPGTLDALTDALAEHRAATWGARETEEEKRQRLRAEENAAGWRNCRARADGAEAEVARLKALIAQRARETGELEDRMSAQVDAMLLRAQRAEAEAANLLTLRSRDLDDWRALRAEETRLRTGQAELATEVTRLREALALAVEEAAKVAERSYQNGNGIWVFPKVGKDIAAAIRQRGEELAR